MRCGASGSGSGTVPSGMVDFGASGWLYRVVGAGRNRASEAPLRRCPVEGGRPAMLELQFKVLRLRAWSGLVGKDVVGAVDVAAPGTGFGAARFDEHLELGHVGLHPVS